MISALTAVAVEMFFRGVQMAIDQTLQGNRG